MPCVPRPSSARRAPGALVELTPPRPPLRLASDDAPARSPTPPGTRPASSTRSWPTSRPTGTSSPSAPARRSCRRRAPRRPTSARPTRSRSTPSSRSASSASASATRAASRACRSRASRCVYCTGHLPALPSRGRLTTDASRLTSSRLAQAVASSTPLFKTLVTTWTFRPPARTVDAAASGDLPPPEESRPTLVTLSIRYSFNSQAHAAASRLFLGRVSGLMVGAFEKRVRELYGPR